MRSSAKQLSRGSTCWSTAANTTACWWRTTAPTEWCLPSRGRRSRDVSCDAVHLGSASQVFQIAEDARSIGREGRVVFHRRAPSLLGGKRIRQVQHPAIRRMNDVLPVAAPSRTLGCEAANGLPANARTACRRGLRHCHRVVLILINAVIQHASGIERLKDAFGAKLSEASINFIETLPGVQKLFEFVPLQ